MKTLTHTLAMVLAIVAFQTTAFAQNQSGDTDWNAVLQEASQRAASNSKEGNANGAGMNEEEQNQQRMDAAQARSDKAGQEPLPSSVQSIMDEARARSEANKANNGGASEPTDDEKFCAAVMCLAKGDPLPGECKNPVKDYFDVRVYKRHTFSVAYDPAATAIKRDDKVRKECKWAPAHDRAKIAARYGVLKYSPFVFN